MFADVPNIDKVAHMMARAMTTKAGQVCVAGSRLVVQRAIAGHLVERICAAFSELKPGNNWELDTTLCPIISRLEMERMDGIVQRSAALGASVLTGGAAVETGSGGAFYRPTRSSDFVIPTGGYTRSGIGRDLGRQAYEANLRHESVLVDFARDS